MAQSILLEPYYRFTLTLPSQRLSKALYDLDLRKAKVEIKEVDSQQMEITGIAPGTYHDELSK